MGMMDWDRVKREADLPAMAKRDGFALTRNGDGFSFRCPNPQHADKKPSAWMFPTAKGYRWGCHGCDAGGSAIDYLTYSRGCSAGEAYSELVGETALSKPLKKTPAQPSPGGEERKQKKREAAREIWRRSVPLFGSEAGALALRYYRSRGIDLAGLAEVLPDGALSSIRAGYINWRGKPVERLWGKSFPAVILAVRPMGKLTGDPTQVHLTYLQEDGTGKAELGNDEDGANIGAKVMVGPSDGGCFSTGPVFNQSVDLAEGPENALSVMQAMLNLGGPVWPVYGALRQDEFRKVEYPKGIQHIRLFTDPRSKGNKRHDQIITEAAERALKTGASGLHISPPDHRDWNQLLQDDPVFATLNTDLCRLLSKADRDA